MILKQEGLKCTEHKKFNKLDFSNEICLLRLH